MDDKVKDFDSEEENGGKFILGSDIQKSLFVKVRERPC